MVPLMPCVLLFFPDAILLGHELQRDKICSLEIAFSGCDYKGAVAVDEGSLLKAELGYL